MIEPHAATAADASGPAPLRPPCAMRGARAIGTRRRDQPVEARRDAARLDRLAWTTCVGQARDVRTVAAAKAARSRDGRVSLGPGARAQVVRILELDRACTAARPGRSDDRPLHVPIATRILPSLPLGLGERGTETRRGTAPGHGHVGKRRALLRPQRVEPRAHRSRASPGAPVVAASPARPASHRTQPPG